MFYRRGGECPLCGGEVPAEIITLRGSFKCTICDQSLKVSGTYELVIRLIALATGYLLARGAGFGGFLLFCFSLMIWPFLVIPIWRVSFALKRPFLIPSGPEVTTMKLTRR